MHGNGQPPAGFRSPVRQALTRKHIVAGVPRELGGILLMLCVGMGLLLETWGAVGVFLLFYGCMYYLTKRDPWWPEVWRDYALLWLALHPSAARLARVLALAAPVAVIAAVLFL
jgi:type IV secretory pathway TrbD component